MHWRMLRLKRKQPCLHERRASSPQCLHGCRNLSQFPNSSNKDTQHPASEPRDRWQVNHDIERERERERERETENERHTQTAKSLMRPPFCATPLLLLFQKGRSGSRSQILRRWPTSDRIALFRASYHPRLAVCLSALLFVAKIATRD